MVLLERHRPQGRDLPLAPMLMGFVITAQDVLKLGVHDEVLHLRPRPSPPTASRIRRPSALLTGVRVPPKAALKGALLRPAGEGRAPPETAGPSACL